MHNICLGLEMTCIVINCYCAHRGRGQARAGPGRPGQARAEQHRISHVLCACVARMCCDNVLCACSVIYSCHHHRSHFGSRYKSGCCGHAGLFAQDRFPLPARWCLLICQRPAFPLLPLHHHHPLNPPTLTHSEHEARCDVQPDTQDPVRRRSQCNRVHF